MNCLKLMEVNPYIIPYVSLLEVLYIAGNPFCNDTFYPDELLLPKFQTGPAYLRFPNLITLAFGMDVGIPNSLYTANHSQFTYFLIWR